jgi:prepilin-type N-terminal cleavage/methylation domain-containing protein
MFKKDSKTYLRQRGFSLVEVMVGVAMLGGLSIAVVQMTKQQSKLSTKSEIDGDVSEVSARILNALNSAKTCSDNFKGKPVGSNMPLGTFLRVIGKDLKVNVEADPWTYNDVDNISKRLRIAGPLQYTVQDVLPPNTSLATLILSVRLQSTDINKVRMIVPKTFSATVLVNGSGIIIGCPKSWNSTVPYL